MVQDLNAALDGTAPVPQGSDQSARTTQFVPGESQVRDILLKSDVRPISVWGVSPVAPIHLAFDELIVRQKKLVELGCQHRVILADYHAMMTKGLSFQAASERTEYYSHYLKSCCELQADYISGSSFQSRIDYVEALFSLVSTTESRLIKNTFPKQFKNSITGKAEPAFIYLYSLMQCLDVYYLGADLIFAEHGQKKIYDLLPKLEMLATHSNPRFSPIQKPHYESNAVLPAIYAPTGHDIKGEPLYKEITKQGDKASNYRISIHETYKSLAHKINQMYAPPSPQGVTKNRIHALLYCFKYSVFPWREQPIELPDNGGELVSFDNYPDFYRAYMNNELDPSVCKDCLKEVLWQRLSKIRSVMGESLSAWVDLSKI